MKAKIYLIPGLLGDSNPEQVLPAAVYGLINSLNHYIVENERTARRFLIKLGIKTAIEELRFFVLDKRTKAAELSEFLIPIKQGFSIGIISEAGCPGVADPGADIVKIAHNQGIEVRPVVGPSSILLALMASGMNGQNFAFNGYLPVKSAEKIQKIRFFEKRSLHENQTQIFIETPYRNQQLLNDFILNCNPTTRLCIACDITLDSEFIKTLSLNEWKKNIPNLDKRPTVFLLHA